MFVKLKEELERKRVILLGRIRRAKGNIRIGETRGDVMKILHDRSKKQIEKVDSALQRIETKSYGVCKKCNQPIALERLEALPTASLCVDCQEKLEH